MFPSDPSWLRDWPVKQHIQLKWPCTIPVTLVGGSLTPWTFLLPRQEYSYDFELQSSPLRVYQLVTGATNALITDRLIFVISHDDDANPCAVSLESFCFYTLFMSCLTFALYTSVYMCVRACMHLCVCVPAAPSVCDVQPKSTGCWTGKHIINTQAVRTNLMPDSCNCIAGI